MSLLGRLADLNRLRRQGSPAFEAGWNQIANAPTCRFAVPALAAIPYPAAYFIFVLTLDHTALYQWMLDRFWYTLFPLFMLVWIWLGLAPPIAQHIYTLRALRRRAGQYRCLACSYALTGTPPALGLSAPRCPECGTQADPSDYTAAP